MLVTQLLLDTYIRILFAQNDMAYKNSDAYASTEQDVQDSRSTYCRLNNKQTNTN